MKSIIICVGLGYGDEGKGAFVNYKCSMAKRPMVVRFNGGHQVGHTVVAKGKRHIFSNFGSGTFQGTPTFWSRFCTVSPTGVFKEGRVLRDMGINPVIYYDAEAMVTTPFDIIQNQNLENTFHHGSVGVGFGQTIQRNEDMYHLYMRDLLYPEIRDQKHKNIISRYYRLTFDPEFKTNQNKVTKKLYNEFLEACDDLVIRYQIRNGLKGLYDYDFIFEGSQGIMLDQNYGFFPNVTRSNCTTKNALELIKEIETGLSTKLNIQTYYVTRAYQTRHGNGPITNESLDTSYIKDNPLETNVGGYQGEFRKSVLDLDLLKYAVECDKYHNSIGRKNMVITCLDQVPEKIPVTKKGELHHIRFNEIGNYCGVSFKFPCYSDIGYQFTMDKF